MKIQDIKNVIELLKLAKLGQDHEKEEDQKERTGLQGISFSLPEKLEDVLPLISVDGSYSFLFSFLGADTWIVLFRIAVTEYCIEMKNGKIHYCIPSAPKIYDNLNVLSLNDIVLNSQPEAFKIVSDIASRFQERKSQIFASNVMTYFEDIILEKISETYNNCILVKDGSLLTFRELKREDIYKNILLNCRKNDIILAGVSKSTSTHIFGNVYTDDYLLNKYYNTMFPDLTYLQVPKDYFKTQTKFDVWGDVHFVKLHEDAPKWFRIDIDRNVKDKNAIFSSLAAYSMVQLLPGYPIGLMEAHKLAKSVRDLKDTYELELLNELKMLGLTSEDILEGAVDFDGREFNSFHEILDQISR